MTVQLFRQPTMRVLTLRSKVVQNPRTSGILYSSIRNNSSYSKLPEAEGENAVGPNMEQQEHVSEEAAKMAKSMGGQGPDLQQGTSVQEILKEDKEALKTAPQVLKDSIKSKQAPPKPQSRPFSTFSRRFMAEHTLSNDAARLSSEFLASMGNQTASRTPSPTTQSVESIGHKFGLPTLPIPATYHKDKRVEPIIDQVTNLMMRHGEKAKAQRNMAYLLQHLRTAPPPVYNANRPLMPGAPPASHLPLNPALYITLALDSLAPLMRIRSQKGAAGGGLALQIPVPLRLRQRRRQSFMWILDSASKKQNKGTGNGDFARRIAEEIIAVVEGKSALWDKRTSVHKIATSARINLGFGSRTKNITIRRLYN